MAKRKRITIGDLFPLLGYEDIEIQHDHIWYPECQGCDCVDLDCTDCPNDGSFANSTVIDFQGDAHNIPIILAEKTVSRICIRYKPGRRKKDPEIPILRIEIEGEDDKQ